MTLFAIYSLFHLPKLRHSLFYKTYEVLSINLAINLTNLTVLLTLGNQIYLHPHFSYVIARTKHYLKRRVYKSYKYNISNRYN